MTTAEVTQSKPTIGDIVQVRGLRWAVAEIDSHGGGNGGTPSTLVELQSVEDGRYGETLAVIWEVEPGARVMKAGSLPDLDQSGQGAAFDPPDQLAAFLDALRWGAVTSAEVNLLQAPFRSGVMVENYQLEPVSRALQAPRVNLLIADDVGLGKTIEAGLVLQELLLRHRARRAMVVCPAGLTLKWQAEMAEKFGLDFTIVNSEQCAVLRRTHGSGANPFRVYPFVIVSLPWLRSPRATRLLDEVLSAAENTDETAAERREFDLLILDEAHHVAPAAPKQRYAVDSQQTKLIRRLAPHFEHRLFLSATPHNGYPESFQALLELIDDQRFARGVEPDDVARREVVVRRLKRDVTQTASGARFLERETYPLEVVYSDDEREAHALLARFAKLRQETMRSSRTGRKAADLVTLLLKKRLFSSPEAFYTTVDVYRDTLRTGRRRASSTRVPAVDDVPDWLLDHFDDVADLDDEELAEEERTAVQRAAALESDPATDEAELLDLMLAWAAEHRANPDSKATKLIEYLKAVCRDGKHWHNERVVVFTEYRDTQTWLERLLRQEGLGGERVALLHGGMPANEREALRQAFQADPSEHPVRILVATDAASEGIDLHWHCHRLVNYDIPFNPNKLEQRIGRIDRYGQTHNPEVRHFVGSGWKTAHGSFDEDLDFLYRVAKKVAKMEEDLGAVNAVLANAVQRRMLGERVDIEAALAAKAKVRGRSRIPSDTDVRNRLTRLHEQVEKAKKDLNLGASNIRRVVETALALARQQPLTPAYDEDEGVYDVPPLTGSWVRATAGLAHPLRPEEQRPVTFEQEVARRRREDVVYAHLNHPLVAMSTRLLRAAVSGGETRLRRVSAVISNDSAATSTLAVAFARFLIVGADGLRLHEEVLFAGGWIRANGRFARETTLSRLSGSLQAALDAGSRVPSHIERRLTEWWPSTRDSLLEALEARQAERAASLQSRLDARRADEEKRVTSNFTRFADTLRRKLGEDVSDDAEYLQLTLDIEARQFERDREAWRSRLDRIPAELDAELELIRRRYTDFKIHLFPVAVVYVVPRQEVVK